MKKFINMLSVCLAFSLAGCNFNSETPSGAYIAIGALILILILVNILWSDKND